MALQRLSKCAAFHGHAQLIYPDLRHDIELMARHRDIKKICLNFTDRTGRVILGPYVVTVTAGKYRLAVPVQAAARISLGGAGQAQLTVHRNGTATGACCGCSGRRRPSWGIVTRASSPRSAPTSPA
ncbi:MAG: hypothetical protein ACLP5E_03825 [Streptosporangiaceae bacterium]